VGGTVARISCCSRTGGRSTASAPSGCGARKAYGSRASAESASGLGQSTFPASRLRAEAPDQVWAIDFQFDQTADGRILKLLHVVDEFTREALAIECHRRIDADHTVGVLERLVTKRGGRPGVPAVR
jgi:transposase InsO family protein